MTIKRRNIDSAKMRRTLKRNRVTDTAYGNSLIYLKLLTVWSFVMMIDFMLDLRVEYLWPFWLMLRSIYDSFQYQGMTFSVFFICITLTSDVICFVFIPMQWIFFIASTYVWVQYVWQADRGICLPTTALWLLFIYFEAAMRLKELKPSSFTLDLCRPFAAHCIGYPVVTLGFGVKSYVCYRLRLRKQCEVKRENRTLLQLLRCAVPVSSDVNGAMDKKGSQQRSDTPTAAAACNGIVVQNGTAVVRYRSSTASRTTAAAAVPSSSASVAGGLQQLESTGGRMGKLKKQSAGKGSNASSRARKSAMTTANGGLTTSAAGCHIVTANASRSATLQQQKKGGVSEASGASMPKKVRQGSMAGLFVGCVKSCWLCRWSVNQAATVGRYLTDRLTVMVQQWSNAFKVQRLVSAKEAAYECPEKPVSEEEEEAQLVNDRRSPTADDGGGDQQRRPRAGQRRTSATGQSSSSSAVVGAAPRPVMGRTTSNSSADAAALSSLGVMLTSGQQSTVSQLKCHLQSSKEAMFELHFQVCQARLVEQCLRDELAKAKAKCDAVGVRLQEVLRARETDRSCLENVQKLLTDSHAAREKFERMFNRERRNLKRAEEAARLVATNSKVECESCKRKRGFEKELKQVKNDLQDREKRIQQLDEQLKLLVQENLNSGDRESFEKLVSGLERKILRLEESLSSETRIKLDLLSALGEARREQDVMKKSAKAKDEEIEYLRNNVEEITKGLVALAPMNNSTQPPCTVADSVYTAQSPHPRESPIYHPQHQRHLHTPVMNVDYSYQVNYTFNNVPGPFVFDNGVYPRSGLTHNGVSDSPVDRNMCLVDRSAVYSPPTMMSQRRGQHN